MWIDVFCDLETDNGRHDLKSPFVVNSWCYRCDYRAIVRCRTNGPDTDQSQRSLPKHIYGIEFWKSFEDYSKFEQCQSLFITHAQLELCKRCGSIGFFENLLRHEVECKQCRGWGIHFDAEEEHYATLKGIFYGARYGLILNSFSKSLRINKETNTGEGPLAFLFDYDGEEYQGLLMPKVQEAIKKFG